ncbi:MAG TPA: histidinol dehydrogenase, partial [Microbacteriaceae bacterium]|nr:histidinol dehydrogenase [Microbacteriaceae bacterium]
MGGEMMRLLDLRGMNITRENAPSFVPRATRGAAEVDASVAELIKRVRSDGLAALQEQALRFDNVADLVVEVSAKELRAAGKNLDRAISAALDEAIRRVRVASEDSLPRSSRTEYQTGGVVSTRYVPIDRAGVYIP